MSALAEELGHRAERQRDVYARMVAGGVGVGGLTRADFALMLEWGDSTENEHADTVLSLVAEVRRLEAERGALAERLQEMAVAEREAGRAFVHRAVAYETAAELVAGSGAF